VCVYVCVCVCDGNNARDVLQCTCLYVCMDVCVCVYVCV